jgi:hypothetical protein
MDPAAGKWQSKQIDTAEQWMPKFQEEITSACELLINEG